MNRSILLLVVTVFAAAPASAEPPTSRPSPASTRPTARVLVISIDGLRPDLALRADTPNLHSLILNGSFSFWARTTPVAITLPSHVSMLTGVIPRKHEVEWNKDLPLKEPVYPAYPTLFEVAKKAGYTTAMAAGKSKFTTLAKPGTLDWSWIPDSPKTEDADVLGHAKRIIREHQPQVMFVHFPSTDNVGHEAGWATAEQREAIGRADRAVGDVLAVLDEVKVRESTFIILTADHGGAGRTHLPDDARARHIPWIAVGPGVRKNLDLTTYPDLVINTEDTFATACSFLKIPRPSSLDGKPIDQVFERIELIRSN